MEIAETTFHSPSRARRTAEPELSAKAILDLPIEFDWLEGVRTAAAGGSLDLPIEFEFSSAANWRRQGRLTCELAHPTRSGDASSS